MITALYIALLIIGLVSWLKAQMIEESKPKMNIPRDRRGRFMQREIVKQAPRRIPVMEMDRKVISYFTL